MADESRDEDIVEQGGRPLRLPGWLPSRLPGGRPSRGAGLLAVAALAVGLAAGYTLGDRHGRGAPAAGTSAAAAGSSAASPAASAPFALTASPALTQDTGACAQQAAGQRLDLGVQVTNQSAAPVTLEAVRAVLPLGGLAQTGWHWGTCGAIPQTPGQSLVILMPGESTWLTVTFRVSLHCPAAAPVQFRVAYRAQGRPATVSLPGFSDLGQVPYSGCQVHPAGV
jgi:hypothetical protein